MPEPIDDLRSSIDAAHAAADRLVQEATERARRLNADVPPRGWEAPRGDGEGGIAPDLAAIVSLLDVAREAVRESVPAELATQLAEAVRDLLLAIRALIDWYIDRLETVGSPAPPARDRDVEDIPID